MKHMTLKNIAIACGGQLIIPPLSNRKGITACTEVLGAVKNSREVENGFMFFAAPGEHTDGHRFIGQAFKNGAYLTITQKTPEQVEDQYGVPAKDWGAYIMVEDSFQALKSIAEFYRSTLQIPVVGITGSVGKTSTKEFIASTLSQKFTVLRTQENCNNEIGVPLTLLSIHQEHEVAVIEMGISEFGEMRCLSQMVRPTICVITNIGQCHLENLKDRDGVLKAKTEIFDFMAPNGEVCLNGDDDKLSTITSVHGNKVHFFGFGRNQGEEVYATDVKENGIFGSTALLYEKNEKEPLEIKVPLPGRHMVINAVAAACVGRILGLTKEQIVDGIANTETIQGRAHLIHLSNYSLIDDCYNANPASMCAAIDLLNLADTDKVAILGDMLELGADSNDMHRNLGKYVGSAKLQVVICIGVKAKYIFEGVKAVKFDCKLFYFRTKEDFLYALDVDQDEIIPRASTILIKASHGMHFSLIVDRLQNRVKRI